MRICNELVNNYCTYLLMILFQTCLVNTLCPSYPSLRCCPDSVWNEERKKCVGCQAGYLGPNCAKSCSHPNYGNRCQFTCTCKGAETCHPSFGCVLLTTTTTTTTSVKTTTEENKESTRNTRTTEFGIRETTTVTANIHAAIGIIFTTSSQIQKETSNVHNDTSYKHTSILLGIFMLCGLFIVLFAVFVGTQIRNKCFKEHNITTPSTYGLYLKPHNLVNSQSLESDILPQVNISLENRDSHYTVIDNYHVHAPNKLIDPHPCQSNITVNLQAEEATTQDRTRPKYIEIIDSPRSSTCVPANDFSTTSYVPMT